MVNELLEGIHLIAAVEAIAIGSKAGINPWILHDIISNAAGNSWLLNLLYFFHDGYNSSYNNFHFLIIFTHLVLFKFETGCFIVEVLESDNDLC